MCIDYLKRVSEYDGFHQKQILFYYVYGLEVYGYQYLVFFLLAFILFLEIPFKGSKLPGKGIEETF